MAGWRLIADVGGTHVRFARALGDGHLADRAERDTADYAAFADALVAYLGTRGGAASCSDAAIAAAGPVSGDAVKLTNGTWTIRRDEVAGLLGGVPVRLFNDLEAAALAIPWLEPADLHPVGAPDSAPDRAPDRAPDTGGARLAVNVGTGFGAAAVVPVAGGWASIAAEPGHMTLGATTEEEWALRTSARPPVTSVEDALSGSGLAALHRFFAGPAPASDGTSPHDVLLGAATDPAAGRATRLFTALLGRIAGDLVLAAGAWGGVYLFGGVIEGWHAAADTHLFREHFVNKGKMSGRMGSVPVYVVVNEAAPLIGLARQ